MIRPITIGLISSQRGDASTPLERDITALAPPNAIQVDYGTEFDDLTLPTSVIATLSDGSLISLPVSWEEGDYDHTADGTYALIGTPFLPLGITNPTFVTASLTVVVLPDFEYDVYVEDDGNDSNTGTSDTQPLLTPEAAVAKAVSLGGPRVIKFGTGEFTLSTYMNVPPLISLIGDGEDNTIFKGASGLNYSANIGNPAYQWGLDKFLINFISGSPTSGIQFFRDISIDGDSRAKHGGIYVKYRNDLTLRNVKVTNFNVCGLWAIDTDALQMLDCGFIDCSQSISEVSTGAVMLGSNTNTLISNLSVNEGRGYGIKAFGPAPIKPTITNLRITGSYVSVNPDSSYGPGNIANISAEFHDAYMVNCEVDNCFFDNVFSFVTPVDQASNYSSSATTLKFHDNTCDLYIRANNLKGYPMEVSAHNVEIYKNHFKGGRDAVIAAWNSGDFTLKIPKNNWLIHSNTFEGQESFYPVGLVRSSYTPLSNFRFLNNTVYITDGTSPHTINVVMTERAMDNTNWTIRNNIILDASTMDAPPAQGGANSLIKLDGGGSVTNLVVTHNVIFGMPVGSIVNGTYNNNITTSPLLYLSGAVPIPFFAPQPGSPVIEAGINVGLPFSGSAPTIGRYEFIPITDAIVESVETLDDILVPAGKPFEELELPTSVNVTLANTSVVQVSVTWTEGSYNPDDEDVYTLTGTLTMPPVVTNPEGLTASINVIVSPALVLFSDSFDREAIGPDYTVQNLTTTLDGSNMRFNGSGGVFGRRILRNTSLAGVNDLEVSMIIQIAELNSTSYGPGLGLQNTVGTDPNKGVFATFHTTTNPDGGTLTLWSGNSTTNNEGFTLQRTSSTKIPVSLGASYELKFVRDIVGSDAIFTATVRNVVTNASTSVTWTEIGAGSMAFASKVAIYHFGGLQQTNNLTAQDLEIASPFPNIASVASVSPISAEYGTAFASLGLPSTLQVTLSDASTPTYNVNWEIGNFSPTTASTYSLIGTIINPNGITNSDNVVATATVTIEPPTVDTTYTYYVDSDAADTSGTGAIGNPFKNGQQAASILTAGQSVAFRGSTDPDNPRVYRETIIPANSGSSGSPITYSVYPGEYAEISGLEEISNTGWTVHSGQIYKKVITLPNQEQNTANPNFSNTVLFCNQIFKDGDMMFEACYPTRNSMEKLFDQPNNMRPYPGNNPGHVQYPGGPTSSNVSITDSTLSSLPSLVGGRVVTQGWFRSFNSVITGHSGSTINMAAFNNSTGISTDWRYRRRYFVTGKLGLLTDEKEWFYDPSIDTLYFRQPGGGSPTGIEYKARNYGFDVRGKSNITITGLQFRGCEFVIGSTASNNIIVDNIKAEYMNHALIDLQQQHPGFGIATKVGSRLIGSNCVVRNSEFRYCSSTVIWAGTNCRVENNYFEYIGYEGNWGAPVNLWDRAGGQKILWNTAKNLGRGAVDFGWINFDKNTGLGGQHFNVEIAYNDFSRFGRTCWDGGAIYAHGNADLTGLEIHHNWIHDNMSPQINDAGGQYSIYFDQSSGYGNIHHNVTYGVGSADLYHEYYNGETVGHPFNIYNNTFAGTDNTNAANSSYRSYVNNPTYYDVQRNNIYRRAMVLTWPAAPIKGNTQFSLPYTTNPIFVGGDPAVIGGLAFRLNTGSPSINAGTPSFVGYNGVTVNVPFLGSAPCQGAYEFTDPDPWVPGYTPVDLVPPGVTATGIWNNSAIYNNSAIFKNI